MKRNSSLPLFFATTQLNTLGAALAELPGVQAMTDVTGFGLAGHLLEICRRARLGARVRFADLPPIIDEAPHWQHGAGAGRHDSIIGNSRLRAAQPIRFRVWHATQKA